MPKKNDLQAAVTAIQRYETVADARRAFNHEMMLSGLTYRVSRATLNEMVKDGRGRGGMIAMVISTLEKAQGRAN